MSGHGTHMMLGRATFAVLAICVIRDVFRYDVGVILLNLELLECLGQAILAGGAVDGHGRQQ